MTESSIVIDKVEEILSGLREKSTLPDFTPEENYEFHRKIDEEMSVVELENEIWKQKSKESADKVFINF